MSYIEQPMKEGEHICVNCGMRCCSLNFYKASNNYISILSELLSLATKIPELEKTARKTPPRHLVAEKEKVAKAKELLAQAIAQRTTLETERDKLLALMGGKHYQTDKLYIT